MPLRYKTPHFPTLHCMVLAYSMEFGSQETTILGGFSMQIAKTLTYPVM